MLGRANDDIPIKLVAMIYPKPPHAVYVLKDSGIAKPKDFEGKTLADTAFSSVPKLFATYAKAAGFDASKTKWIAANSDALPGMLTTKRVDGIGQYHGRGGASRRCGGAAGGRRLSLRGRGARLLQQRHRRFGRHRSRTIPISSGASSRRRCAA